MSGEIVELAELLSNRLEEDIKLCRTRDEHIRVTARANEARELLNRLLNG
jgi:hypothetical protein